MGGIETDLDGRTSIAGLFAAGEAACTGVHGANRLASNSLLEGLVFGARAAAAMAGPIRPTGFFAVVGEPVPLQTDCSAGAPVAHAVRDLMWRHAGLLRSRETLEGLVARLSSWRRFLTHTRPESAADRDFRRLSSLVTVSVLIARAALRREESRGGHFRTDFPHRDDIHWQRHVADVLAGSRL
jgi:L-aspartate oxidase